MRVGRERERENGGGGQNKLNTLELLAGAVWVLTTLAFFCGGLNEDDVAFLDGCKNNTQHYVPTHTQNMHCTSSIL